MNQSNQFKRLDITDAEALLGYAPVDDLLEEHRELKELKLRDRLGLTDGGQQSGIGDKLAG